MKKILIKRCIDCPRMGRYFNNACHRAVTDVNHIPADCPLEDEVDNWIPVTRIHERIKALRGKNIDPEIMIARIDELKLLLPKFDRGEEMKKDLDLLDGWIPVSERLPEIFRERVIHAIKVWELENKRVYTRAKIEKVLALLPDSFWELSVPQGEKVKK